MEKKYVVPATTFLSGFFLWVAFFASYLLSTSVQAWAPWVAITVCLAVGGLILFSAIRCKQVGGPSVGGIVRASVLAVFAVLTFWKIGIISAGILLVAAALVVISVRPFQKKSA